MMSLKGADILTQGATLRLDHLPPLHRDIQVGTSVLSLTSLPFQRMSLSPLPSMISVAAQTVSLTDCSPWLPATTQL